ncbi:MAG: hypothetical protein GWN58_33515 [Anaerolineae bacterium]|nr:hypothetical protein [Thermoplasmata archaeon]NIV34196.1 hypothetical protein [Anaerolineae bacterium]NIY06045.1 hypothetical protein [Thermoplasmata archaeon]
MALIQHIRNAAGAQIDKKWIGGIRKGWKQIASQMARVKERNEGLDTLEALDNGLRYLALLKQELFFGKGLYPFHGGDKTLQKRLKEKAPFNIQAKVTVHLEKAEEALEEAKRKIKYWMNVTNPQTAEHKLDGGQRVKEITEDPRWAGRSPGMAIMRFLNQQAPAIAAEEVKVADIEISGKLLRALSSFAAKYPGMEIGDEADQQFTIGRMKVVVQPPPVRQLRSLPAEEIKKIRSPSMAKSYVKPLAQAKTLLDKKKLGFLWYGLTQIKCKTCGGKNPLDTPEKVWGVGGDYEIGKDQINVYVDPKAFVVELMVHELGHRYYYKFMSKADRAEFSSYFGQVPGVSDYGKTVSAEDFAEVFAWYVLNRELTRDQLERFKKFLGRKKQRGAAAEKRGGIIRIVRGRAKFNVKGTDGKKARDYALKKFKADNKSLYDVLPEFDVGYLLLRRRLGKALNVPRIDMPVIRQKDLEGFSKHLQKEHDVTPRWKRLRASSLLPTQSQIWLDKLMYGILKDGPLKAGDPRLDLTIIVSKEGYILDGHHRWASALITDPSLSIKALWVPIRIKELLPIAKEYGESAGNAPRAEVKGKGTGGLKGPFVEKGKYWASDTYYKMDVTKDRFIHFTTVEAAQSIAKSKKLLLRPPGVQHFGPVGVFAVSLVWGWYVPGTQLTHIKSDKPLVAVVFTTNTVPDGAAHHEEVFWDKDVKLKTVQVVSKGKAIQLLKRVPFPLKDEDAYVLYS